MEQAKIKNAEQYVTKLLLEVAEILKTCTYLAAVGPAHDMIVRTIKTLCGDEVTKIYNVEFMTGAGGDERTVRVYTGEDPENVAYIIPFKAFVKVQKIMNRFSVQKHEV